MVIDALTRESYGVLRTSGCLTEVTVANESCQVTPEDLGVIST